MGSTDRFRLVHVGALALCLVLMPWSTALLSMAQILLALNWISEGIIRKDRGERWSRAFGSAPSLLFLAFLGVHVIGLLWTSPGGMSWGWDLVRTLLPVLVFGVVLAGSARLSAGEYRTILLLGAWSVIASTVVCLIMRGVHAEYRQLSVFISHIRLALFLCMSIVVFLYYARGAVWRVVAHVAAALWAMYYMNLLGSIQSMVIMLVLGVVLLWRWAARMPPARRLALRAAAVLPIFGMLLWTTLELRERYASEPVDTTQNGGLTAGGEAYEYALGSGQRENGNLVWSEIAWAEVERTWYHRSARRLDSLDDRGHLLYPTLFRYLASMDLPKDSVSIMALSEEDVRRVEAGIPNHLWGQRSRLRDRFDEVMFEIDQYFAEGRVSGHSVTMRLEFWKAGLSIARENLWTGIGTGDTQITFDREYERMQTQLAEKWRHRAHNQYLTLLISFGLPGLLLLLFCLWWPAWKLGAWRNTLFIAWAIIIGIGSFTDDTIETQAGATFFALYYAFFVFAAPRKTDRYAPHRVAGGVGKAADARPAEVAE